MVLLFFSSSFICIDLNLKEYLHKEWDSKTSNVPSRAKLQKSYGGGTYFLKPTPKVMIARALVLTKDSHRFFYSCFV